MVVMAAAAAAAMMEGVEMAAEVTVGEVTPAVERVVAAKVAARAGSCRRANEGVASAGEFT